MTDATPILMTIAFRRAGGLACATGLLMCVSPTGIEVAFEPEETLWTEEEGEVVVVSALTEKGALGALARALPLSSASENVRRFGFAAKDGSLHRWLGERRVPALADSRTDARTDGRILGEAAG